MKAFNAAHEEYGEERAFKIAWAAVKRAFHKNKEGKWVANDAIDDAFPPEEDLDEEAVCDPESDEYDEEECERLKAEKAKARTKDSISLTETMTLDRGGMRMTTDGYLVANARVARTGIQLYQADEVGLDAADPRKVVRVYRPESSVFANRCTRTFAHRPVTLDHPPEMVNAHNWRDYAVGHVDGEIMRDGDMIKVPMMITDAKAIAAVRAGASQLSVGYEARLEMKDGVTPTGERYDAVQHDIRVNHIALTPAARGGPQLRLGDDKPPRKDRQMDRADMLRTLSFDGVQVKLSDADASIINGVIDRLNTEKQTLVGQVAALTQQVRDATVTDADLDARVTQRQMLVAQARRVLGDSWSPDGKSATDIRRAAVAARLGDDVGKALSDAAIEGAFAAVTSDNLRDGSGTRELALAMSRPGHGASNTQGTAEEAWEKRGETMREAWKGNNGSMVRQ